MGRIIENNQVRISGEMTGVLGLAGNWQVILDLATRFLGKDFIRRR